MPSDVRDHLDQPRDLGNLRVEYVQATEVALDAYLLSQDRRSSEEERRHRRAVAIRMLTMCLRDCLDTSRHLRCRGVFDMLPGIGGIGRALDAYVAKQEAELEAEGARLRAETDADEASWRPAAIEGACPYCGKRRPGDRAIEKACVGRGLQPGYCWAGVEGRPACRVRKNEDGRPFWELVRATDELTLDRIATALTTSTGRPIDEGDVEVHYGSTPSVWIALRVWKKLTESEREALDGYLAGYVDGSEFFVEKPEGERGLAARPILVASGVVPGS